MINRKVLLLFSIQVEIILAEIEGVVGWLAVPGRTKYSGMKDNKWHVKNGVTTL